MKKLIIALSAVGVVTLIATFFVYATVFRIINESQQPTVVAAAVVQPPDPQEIENRVNAYRSEKGLSILADSEVLSQAAQARADQMCYENEWNHDDAWAILDPRYSYYSASENLSYGVLSEDSARMAIDGWVKSDGHRENMLKDHQELGVGVKACPGFQGLPNAVIVTNYFGVPR